MRIGTVGSGSVVANFIEAARLVEGVELAAVYSRTPERAGDFAKAQGIERFYCDRKEFLSSDLDFVYVASPNSLHFDWAKEALLSGKNVLCEKPFTSTFKELMELSAIAKERGLFLFEAMTVPHLPNIQLIKEKLGEIGKLRLAQANFSQYSSRYDAFLRGEKPNVFNPEYSGGALMDLNCYNLGFFTELFGAPIELSYKANIAENGIDTSGVITLGYGSFSAVAAAAKDSRSRNFVQVQGEEGYIYAEGAGSVCASFKLFTKDSEQEFNLQADKNPLYFEVADFYRIYTAKDFGGRDFYLEKSLRLMGLLEQARKSAGIGFPADSR